MADNGRLTPAQRRSIAALLTSRDVREAAQAARIGERTLGRWLTMPYFRAELSRAEDDILAAAARRLMALQDKATARLEATLDDEGAPPAVRLRAAQIALDATWRAIELARLSQRLAQLEARLGADDGND